MSDFKAKMHQIRFRLGLRPRPRWGSLQRSPRPQHCKVAIELCQFRRRVVESVGVDVGDVAQKLVRRFIVPGSGSCDDVR